MNHKKEAENCLSRSNDRYDTWNGIARSLAQAFVHAVLYLGDQIGEKK